VVWCGVVDRAVVAVSAEEAWRRVGTVRHVDMIVFTCSGFGGT
jgi:hypothetical protein